MRKKQKMTLREKELRKVTRKLNKEMSKSEDKIDMETVNECFRRLDELQGGVCKKTDAELTEGLIKAKKEGDSIRAEIAKNEISRSCDAPRKIPFKRSFAIAALSVFLVIGLSFSALAISLGGYSKAWTYVSNSVKTLLNINPSANDTDGITIIKGTYSRKYDNIEELLISENIDILYPSKLPNNIEIEQVTCLDINSERKHITVQFNDTELSFIYYNYCRSDLSLLSNYSIYKSNNITFYIIEKKEENKYSAVAQINNSEYAITYNKYNDLIHIIDNIEEVNK